MTTDRVREALTIAANSAPPPDLAAAAWSRGRRVRRRHRSAATGVGALAAVGVLSLGGWWATGGRPADLATVDPAAQGSVRVDLPTGGDSAPFQVWVERKAACLEDFGFEVDVVEDGLGARPTEASPRPGLRDSGALCDARVGSPAPVDGAFTDDQLRTVYGWYVEGHACLVAAGQDVEPPPDPAVFVADARRAAADPQAPPAWNPWADVDRLSLLTTCPPPGASEVP